jgi:hypothetical protein
MVIFPCRDLVSASRAPHNNNNNNNNTTTTQHNTTKSRPTGGPALPAGPRERRIYIYY